MQRLGVPIILLLLLLFSGAVWALFAYLDLPAVVATAPPSDERARSDPARQAVETERTEASHDNAVATFDVARIDPEGTSVFAGRAKPGSSVTIVADGEAIGSTEADENGEWTFAVEHRFASSEPSLALRTGPPLPKREPRVASTGATEAEQRPIAPPPGERGSAVTVTDKLLKNLEGMVETARVEQRQQVAPPAAPATVPESEPDRSRVAAVDTSPHPAQPVVRQSDEHKSVPVPITFVYNEANFTENGRKAAELLLEYLKIKRFPAVRLTGHADERGTEAFNMELSRERLETVAKFLRENGYNGELELIPKGKSEPFTGVVRSEYDQEELWQLDRRVELLVTQ